LVEAEWRCPGKVLHLWRGLKGVTVDEDFSKFGGTELSENQRHLRMRDAQRSEIAVSKV
jgi:hypothetical protein